MPLHQAISHLVTRRRGLMWLIVALLAGISIFVLVTRMKLDSEVLNLLPSGFESVEGLKVYNRDFAQVRELTFALSVQPGDVEELEEFAPDFAEMLRQQPWCARVLAGSPLETPEGMRDLQGMAVPLLLNLDPPAFHETIALLQPERIRERLQRLREEIEAGSPRPQFELELDPLGVIAPALRPFAENATVEDDQPLASPDGTLRIFMVVTNQPTLSAFDSHRLMEAVNAFRVEAQKGWAGAGPLEVLVTGRSAYVAEISLSMRHDIIVTVIGSIVLVGGVFFIGFHRWLPLIGMGFSLLLCCLVALAAGLLIFGELNMVTVGFCAILIGLGVDFAILIFGKYQQARDDGFDHTAAVGEAVRNLGRAIFFGALTTAVGFLALLLANSPGFTQLGVLIAIGIFLAGLFMMTVFFLFVPAINVGERRHWLFSAVKNYVVWTVRKPAIMLWIFVPVLLLLTAIAISPWPPLIFDASTRSMEPKESDAGHALHTIMNKMPERWEPAIGIVRSENVQQLHDQWQKVAAHWGALQQAGKIRSFSTPAALALSPRRLEVNRTSLGAVDLAAARQALETAVAEEGFSAESFAAGFALLDGLAVAAQPGSELPDWRTLLPKSSSWWFLVDRYFSHDPLLTTGFVTTHAPITTQAQNEMLEREMPVEGVPLTLSGWSFTLADLVPWSQRQLIVISALMAIFEAGLLALLYRDWRLWLIQVLSLAFAVTAMIASMKLLAIPLNILNVLAFRLVLAVGVDYGIYVLLVWQKAREVEHDVAGVIKPVILAGLTAIAGFGSLGLANNPTLAGLGIACALGIFWSLACTVFFTLPATAAWEPKAWREASGRRPEEMEDV
ncbi:hypothetical protein BH20VER2_BH20VER2_05910 [soil metagenome]